MSWARRDFLALVLGAPLAAACRGGRAVRIPDGELLTPGKAVGSARNSYPLMLEPHPGDPH